MYRDYFCRLLAAFLALWALSAQGCGKKSPDQTAERAEAAIDEFLGSWARGESPDKFAAANQRVRGTDPDWSAGHRLLSFLSVESKLSQEAPQHVRCRVALSLQDRKGKKVDKEVTYDVQVGSTTVIARASP